MIETRTDITSREETRTEVPSTVMLASTCQPFVLQASREPTIDTGSEGRKGGRGGGEEEEGREGEEEEEGGKGREGGCSMSTNHRYRPVRPGGRVMGEAMITCVLAVKEMRSQSLNRFSTICG